MERLTADAAEKAMQSVSSASTANSTSSSDPAATASSEPLAPEWLRQVWKRMAAIYPGTWAVRMGDSPQHPATAIDVDGIERPHPRAGQLTVYGDTWAKGLTGLTGEQLARGLKACITRANRYLPDLGEFRALCIGIPSMSDIRTELRIAMEERSPFALLVGRKLDWHAFRSVDWREAERMLRAAYDDARDAVMRGEPLPDPLPAIAKDNTPPKPKSPDVARAALTEINAMLRPYREDPPA